MTLSPELEAIKDSWDKNTGGGRDDAGTRALCHAYVDAHPEQFTQLRGLTIEQVVDLISHARAADMGVQQWIAEVWQLHHFPPQNVVGELIL